MRIERHTKGSKFEIEVKRFYIPFTVTSKCPKCGVEKKQDLSKDYLSYPIAGKPEKIYFYCSVGHANEDWSESVVLDITLKEEEK